MMPLDIQKHNPKYWLNDDEEGGKNKFEKELLAEQLNRLRKNIKMSYNKVTNLEFGKKLVDNFTNLSNNDLNVIVYNFVDMLSHARTDMKVIRELAEDEAAYRSLTLSWFNHSPLLELIKKIADSGGNLFITTDHGMIKVDEPSKVIGDRNTNTNLRYKQGRNLQYQAKEVFEVRNPNEAKLPKINMSSAYIFALTDKFFVYPNNYNHFVNHYRGTFQHGGVSIEEMVIPYVSLSAK